MMMPYYSTIHAVDPLNEQHKPAPPREPGLAIGYSEMDWAIVLEKDRHMLVHLRERKDLAEQARRLLKSAPFARRGTGTVAEACAALGEMPEGLANDVELLAQNFSDLMATQHIQIRLEAIISNCCRKIHADCTDVRLITTYAGPATQVLRSGAEPTEDNLWFMEPGWIGLFKGKDFGHGHPFCLHRSPPAKDLQASRLILVIDSPQFPTSNEVA